MIISSVVKSSGRNRGRWQPPLPFHHQPTREGVAVRSSEQPVAARISQHPLCQSCHPRPPEVAILTSFVAWEEEQGQMAVMSWVAGVGGGDTTIYPAGNKLTTYILHTWNREDQIYTITTTHSTEAQARHNPRTFFIKQPNLRLCHL